MPLRAEYFKSSSLYSLSPPTLAPRWHNSVSIWIISLLHSSTHSEASLLLKHFIFFAISSTAALCLSPLLWHPSLISPLYCLLLGSSCRSSLPSFSCRCAPSSTTTSADESAEHGIWCLFRNIFLPLPLGFSPPNSPWAVIRAHHYITHYKGAMLQRQRED